MGANFDFTPGEGTRANQRRALLRHMQQHGSITTLEAREGLGVASPAARILELKRQGVQIETRRVFRIDAAGRRHSVAEYISAGVPA